jgi:hypothetical protein
MDLLIYSFEKRGGVLSQEKWELSAVNADLQQRLQQTVALAHMQVIYI